MVGEQISDYDPELTSAGIGDKEYLPMTSPDETPAPERATVSPTAEKSDSEEK